MNLSTSNLKFSCVFLAIKTIFWLSHKHYQKTVKTNFEQTMKSCFRNDTLTIHSYKFWCSILPCTSGWTFSVQFSEVFIENLIFFVLLASVGEQIPFSIELKLLRRNQSLFYTYLRSMELYRVLKLRLYQCFDFHISFPTKTFDNC